ncbi:MAG TPA: NAD-dependent succinate-semialdehyde dehydrogenase [Spongiibacteraceae bacterium]|nr:NAD-dependent succinate-semialdehyde dehydrogenase [Spongiibacteraceae bacterium]
MRLTDQSLLKDKVLIGSAWCAADSGKTLAVTNPSNDDIVAQVPDCGAAETQRAIAAADTALIEWRATTANQRGKILQAWSELIVKHATDLAQLLTLEQGKPLAEARTEIAAAAAFLQWFAEEAKRVYGDVIPSAAADRRLLVIKQPIGVCAAITPWNFPCSMIARKVAPALAAGCTMVLKPAEKTPLSALALAELALRAGVPAGVFNVVIGDPQIIGAELTANATVRKLSFTGSTAVGRLLMAQCAPTLKKLSLELGGNAPFIVFDDADLDAAVAGAIAAKYRNSGQTCICANRVLVQENIYEVFIEKFAAATAQLQVGDGFTEGVAQGPLIDAKALQKVETLLEDAVAKGARVVSGGQRHALGGTFYQPTVLRDIDSNMRVAHEEIFGPLAPVWRFRDEAEAIAIANATEYGLAAYFYTRDMARIWRVSEALEYGMIGINTATIGSEAAPFGGMKQSGFGREGSKYGIDEYLEIKYLCMGGL